ncbi:MAG: N-acetyl-alpha-D-glucosaminyl L-malate synthase BshA [Planctomycetota bacterium]|jgi:N-acetyl-alpha-D-glucosaminyl L-malate synthase BshA
MKIAIACYPTYGGSGVMATELGIALADRGHEVHFLSYEPPHRLGASPHTRPNVSYHEVQVAAYPLFRYPPYDLALASRMVEVVESHGVELLHAHYAVPHAISAVLAREISGRPVKVLTTLHGTDVTLIGQDKSYLPATRWGIEQSDGITAVSAHLKEETRRIVHCNARIEVIHNFVDTDLYRPARCEEMEIAYCREGEKVLLHVSNFRAVKRPDEVIRIFERVAREVPARLLLVGEGPELPRAESLARDLGVRDRVELLGQRGQIERILPCADVLLLPSETESFGLAALEAMACGVPPAASRVGGLPEVVEDGISGLLEPLGEEERLAQRIIGLLSDDAACSAMGSAARARAVERFGEAGGVSAYEAAYRRLLTEDR